MAEDDNPYRRRSVPIEDDFNPYRSVPKAGKEPELAEQQQSAFRPGLGEDIQRSMAAGLVRGTAAIPGTPGDLADTGVSAYEWGKNVGVPWLKGQDPTPYQHQPVPYLPTTEDLTKQVAKVFPDVNYKPQYNISRYLGAGAAMAPATFALGGRGVGAGLEALAAGAGGQAAGDLSDKYIGGATPRMLAQYIGAGAGPIVGRRFITPPGLIPADRQFNNQTLKNAGITSATAGEQTGQEWLKYLEEKGGLPDSELQKSQFTKFASKTFGADEERLKGPTMEREYHRIGNGINDLGARNTGVADPPFKGDMTNAVKWWTDHTNPSERKPIVEKKINEIIQMGQANNGVIPGEAYNRIRSGLSDEIRNPNNTYETQHVLHDVQHALDDMMERNSSPKDVAAWKEYRHQYKNFLIVEKALQGPGAETAAGLVSPLQLASAAKAVEGRRAYGFDHGDFAPVIDAAVATMPRLPNSGTAQRLEPSFWGSALGALTGAFGTGEVSGEGAAAGGAIGAFAPHVAGQLAATPLGQKYLANQLLGDGPTMKEHFGRALLGRGGAP